MKQNLMAALALSLAGNLAHAQDCDAPEMPTLPDGGSSTMDQMIEGQKAVKAFQADNMVYLECLNKSAELYKNSATGLNPGDEREKLTGKYNDAIEAYNSAVTAEEELAGQFNTEIREYKAKNPG